MQVELDGEESRLLHRILQAAVDDLRVEVHHSKGEDNRAELKHREAVIGRLLEKLDKARSIAA